MEYIIHLLILSGIYIILAISLDLIVGYTGLLSIAHASLFGIGAYATAILTRLHGVNFFWSMVIGIGAVAVISLLIGLVLSRFDGDYYMLVTIGFNIIVATIFINWVGLTKGAIGIAGIPRPELLGFTFSSNASYLFLIIIFVALSLLLVSLITKSSFGRVLQAIREDEEAIQIFGYKTHLYKLAIFVIGAIMAAVAGSLMASYITFIDPTAFLVRESILIITIIIFGGLANIRGAVLGAVVLILLPEGLRFIGFSPDVAAQLHRGIYGLTLVLLMLYRPKGLLGKYKL